MRLADLFSSARALGRLRAAHLIAATAAKYTAQYFPASSPSESRITPPGSTLARRPFSRRELCLARRKRALSNACHP